MSCYIIMKVGISITFIQNTVFKSGKHFPIINALASFVKLGIIFDVLGKKEFMNIDIEFRNTLFICK